MCKWNLSPLFWTWNLAKLKYWYYEMHLTMKNHIIIHSNVFFIIKLGVVCVCCRNITGSGKKNWLWGIFHIAKCPNFYELIYDFSGQKISKNGISRQSSNYKDSFFASHFSLSKHAGSCIITYISRVFGFLILKISRVLTSKISLE